MYNECRHIMPSGARCHAPSLHGKPCCYFHTSVHRQSAPKGPFDDLSIKFPVLEDRRTIQLALTSMESFALHRDDSPGAGSASFPNDCRAR